MVEVSQIYVIIQNLNLTAQWQHNINIEAEKYGDVLQEDFVDSYANLTLKSLFSLR